MRRRRKSYGPPRENFARIAVLWTAHLETKYGFDYALKEDDVAWMMIQVKQARDMHEQTADNLIDTAGYAEAMSTYRDV